MNESKPQPVRILLFEDNPGDAAMMRMALRESGLGFELTVLETGVAAVAFAKEQEVAPQPDLVLLDYNLPGATGAQVLQLMRASARWREIPVIVVSGSERLRDQTDSVALGATAFLHKPADLDSYLMLGTRIRRIWEALRAPSLIREARDPRAGAPRETTG